MNDTRPPRPDAYTTHFHWKWKVSKKRMIDILFVASAVMATVGGFTMLLISHFASN